MSHPNTDQAIALLDMITPAPKATPKAKAANAATPVTKARVTTFVKAYKTGEQSVVTKARVIGESIASGSTVGKVTEQLRDALTADGLIIPKSFSAAITHYNTAYTAANTLSMTSSDAVLHALYQISTGVVKAADREAFVLYHTEAKSTPEQVVSAVRTLIAKARASKATPKADRDAAVTEHVAELEAEQASLSPIADLKALLVQAGALLDVLADNSPDDYATAHGMLESFVGKYLTIEDGE